MNIGDLVTFNSNSYLYEGQTGVIIRSQKDSDGTDWFEVLSLEDLIVVPETQVSLIWSPPKSMTIFNKENKNA
tara:strand:- start:293 stop:511 length:219 start_codon:yes stop_codon:yes gene_type:complete